MATRWILEAIGLFATTSGALLAFLAHQRLPTLLAADGAEPRRAAIFLAQHRKLGVVLAVIAASLTLQCAAKFF
jgi:hypothetical protein